MNVLELREEDGVFDFVVDGVSLRPLLRTDNTSTLRPWDRPQGFARELVDGDGSLEGRVPIYACRKCWVKLDTWDGGHAVRIGRSNERIIWHEIEEFGNSVGDTFEFELEQYRTVLEPFLSSRA